jgi:hypothetical protein
LGAQHRPEDLDVQHVGGRDHRPTNAVLPGWIDSLRYQLRCIDDIYAWLVEQGDWVDLGAADEQKPAKEGTVEAWGRSEENPAGGWYGLRKGYRGRFGMYVPPLLEVLGKVELTHEPRNNKVRAIV